MDFTARMPVLEGVEHMTSVERSRFVVPGRVLFAAWVIPTIAASFVARQPGADDLAVVLTLGTVAFATAVVGFAVAVRIGIPMRRSVVGKPFDMWFWAAMAWACAWAPVSAFFLGLTMADTAVNSLFLWIIVFAWTGLGCQGLALLGFARYRRLSARAIP